MSNPVEAHLVNIEATVPPPDMLLVGVKGAHHTDIVRVRVASDSMLKRGTLLMTAVIDSEKVFTVATEAGLAVHENSFAILADDVDIKSDEHADMAAYFEGDFNENAVIFPWVADVTDQPAAIEASREILRKNKIFLRAAHI